MTTKQIVLNALKSGEVVSGEFLADTAHVSRAAVWKAVNSLRRDGYTINASTKKGYFLNTEKPPVTQKAIEDYLSRLYPESKVKTIFFSSIDSTNNELKRLAVSSSSLHKTAVIALEQTAGRGRWGRSFFSSAKTGVFMSLLYSPKCGVTDPARMTANAAVAVSRAIFRLYGVEAQIKWVNDVFLGGKKVCGILTEGVSNLETGMIDSAIVGIGINIAAGVAIPDEVREVAGFIEDYTDGKECDKNLVIASVLGELVKIYDNIEDGNKDEEQKCLEEYRNRSLLTGLTVKVSPVIAEEKTSYNARVVGISDELALIVETDSGEKRYLKSGEVTLKSANIAKLS